MHFLAVDKLHLKSASFDGPHTPLMCVFQPFIATRQDQVLYKTQIFEQKQGSIAYFPLLIPKSLYNFFGRPNFEYFEVVIKYYAYLTILNLI